jgi:hypothetical protein
VEAAFEKVRNKATIHLSELTSKIGENPLYWVRWGLAFTPFFIVAPVVSLGLTFYLKEHRRDVLMMTIAIVNIILSLLFLNTLVANIGEWLPSLFRGVLYPLPSSPIVTI